MEDRCIVETVTIVHWPVANTANGKILLNNCHTRNTTTHMHYVLFFSFDYNAYISIILSPYTSYYYKIVGYVGL